MDAAEASVFAQKLLECRTIAGWRLLKKISHGKSAVVMLAENKKEQAALKIFHPGLIDGYGREAQLIRLNRERDLINKDHPNIIKIIDAGECANSGHLFVTMEYDSGIPLSKALNSIAKSDIGKIIEQLAQAAKQLEDWGLTHRDIKPDNIHIDTNTFSKIKLLDFGVVKPHGDHSATTIQISKGFLGTHQYSPPEMIHGQEEDTIDGWRAITFYQIGAVLHDLIKSVPIFNYATTRHADLVTAIDNDSIILESSDVDPILCNLATRCLLKRPKDRLELIRWEDFMLSEQQKKESPLNYRKDLLLRRLSTGAKLQYVDAIANSEHRRLAEMKSTAIVQAAKAQFDQCLAELGALIPARTTVLDGKTHPGSAITYTFSKSSKMGFSTSFRVQISVEEIENSSLVEVYIRASKGVDETEIGWTPMGPHLPSLDGMSDKFQEWMLSIIEELTTN